jgi:hypothetical protein
LITGTNNAHFSYYSRTNSQVTNELLMGCNNFGAAPAFYLRIRDNTNLSQAYFSSTVVNQASATETDSRGLFMGNMQNATLRQLFKNKTVSNQNTNSETFVKNSANVYLASYNNNNTPLTFTNKECAFASIGNGMSNVEQALFYDIVQEYQTILGRNV